MHEVANRCAICGLIQGRKCYKKIKKNSHYITLHALKIKVVLLF